MTSRLLKFLATNAPDQSLKNDTTLVLTFQPLDRSKLYAEQFPVVWKTIVMAKGQNVFPVVEYTARLAVGTTTTGNDLVTAGPFVEMQPGQTATLTVSSGAAPSPSDPPQWSVPTGKSGRGPFTVTNKTGFKRDISVGFVNQEYIPGTQVKMNRFLPVLTWQNVAQGSTVSLEFTPRLKVYAISNYKESQIIRGEVENSLGTFDLAKLYPPSAGKENIFHVFTDRDAGDELKVEYLGDAEGVIVKE